MLERDIKVEYIDITRLRDWDKNPRDNEGAALKLAKLIESYGFINPIIVTPDMVVRAGHTRIKAARHLGMGQVPAVVVSFGSEREAEAFSLADNKAGEWAEWNLKALTELLLEIDTGEMDMDLTGFSIDEIEELINRFAPDEIEEEEDFYLEEELESIETPTTELGDLWLLGRHRVLCGDSLKREAIDLLMGGHEADMIFTDPPYNVDYTGGTKDALKIQNDKFEDQEFFAFLFSAFDNMFRVTRMGSPFYIFHADSEGLNFRRAAREAGFNHTQTLIWVKNTFVLGRQDYHWQHEPILYGWKPGAPHRWYGERNKSTVLDDDIDVAGLKKAELVSLVLAMKNQMNSSVIREDKPSRNSDHPTLKPLPIIRKCIENSSRRGEIVLDSFLGSGSTLIAAEQLNRVCHGMELDPRYADVIVSRYLKFKHSTKGVRLVRGGEELHISEIDHSFEVI